MYNGWVMCMTATVRYQPESGQSSQAQYRLTC